MKFYSIGTATALVGLLASGGVSAATLSGIGEFEGTAGVGSANGVVASSPLGGNYVYVSTDDGVDGQGLGVGSETNGSSLVTNAFSADAGDVLSYFFNYITSDGSGFADYAYAQLVDATTLAETALIFTARTQPAGNIVPGFDLPPISDGVTLTPPTTEIIPGGPDWAELGSDSGRCFAAGCGYTGWIASEYTIADAGSYRFKFGVVNWDDELYQSGLAIDGLQIDGVDIIPTDPGMPVIPLPAGGILLLSALGGLALQRRRKAA